MLAKWGWWDFGDGELGEGATASARMRSTHEDTTTMCAVLAVLGVCDELVFV